MLTVVAPTEVTMTRSSGALLVDWLGYRFTVVGCVIWVGCGAELVGGGVESEPEPEEPQAARHPAASAAIRRFGRNLMFMDFFLAARRVYFQEDIKPRQPPMLSRR
jgi:hypothetical protein